MGHSGSGWTTAFAAFEEGSSLAFRSEHGLPENTVNCVLLDDLDCLWLSGLRGIHRAKRMDLNAVAEGHADRAQFRDAGHG